MYTFLFSLAMTLQIQNATEPLPSSISSLQHFITAVSDIFDAGPQLWVKIGHYQADRAAQTITTQLANIEEKKIELKSDLHNNRLSEDDFLERVHEIQRQLDQLKNTIARFAFEIDSTSPRIAAEMRAVTDEQMYGKSTLLIEAIDASRRGNPHQAKLFIDKSIGCVQQTRSAAECLNDVIQTGSRPSRLECTSQELRKARSACLDVEAKTENQLRALSKHRVKTR